MLKKAALSLLVIGTSGAWVWSQSATRSSDDLAAAPPAAASESPEAVAAVAVEPPLIVREFANTGDPAATAPSSPPAPIKVQSISIDPSEVASTATIAERTAPVADESRDPTSPPAGDVPLQAVTPRSRVNGDATARPIAASARLTAKSHGGLTDGAYDGPAVDAFYGLVQIRANVRNGKLANIQVLQFPSDRRTSIAINRHALPMLTLQAIADQSADVDAVSGATLTSEAFMESLGAALQQAGA